MDGTGPLMGVGKSTAARRRRLRRVARCQSQREPAVARTTWRSWLPVTRRSPTRPLPYWTCRPAVTTPAPPADRTGLTRPRSPPAAATTTRDDSAGDGADGCRASLTVRWQTTRTDVERGEVFVLPAQGHRWHDNRESRYPAAPRGPDRDRRARHTAGGTTGRRARTKTVATIAEHGVRVAIYVRRSTDEEHQPFSTEAQDARLKSYVKSQPGWSLVARFEDDASGAKLDRPGLRKALAAAAAGRYDVLLVYRVDRFTRSIRDLATLLDELDHAGVGFRSATEPFDTSTPAGRMLVQMLGVFAEFEREMIIDRVINGMERKAAKGKWTVGTEPFGYSRDTEHHLVAIDDEITIVKLIFYLYTRRRLGCRAIATHLNERNLLRRRAHRKAVTQPGTQPWSHKTVTDVLTNRVYLGEVHFREIVAVDAHAAVIDPATFDLAQKVLAERGEMPAKKAMASSDYHLTGKITCPACNQRYLGTNAYGRSRTYRYYTCFTRNRYSVDRCSAPRIHADTLDALVLDALRDFYTNHLDEAERAIADARNEQHQARDGYAHELAEVQEQLAAKEEVVDRYLTEYEDNKLDRETVARRIEKLSDQIRQLRHRRDELTYLTDIDDQDLSTSYLTEIRDRIGEIISTGTTQERKTMCEALLAELRIDGDTATPVINVPLSRDDIPTNLQVDVRGTTPEAVRERPPIVGRAGLEPATEGL
jgi:site-specific DNA recombinase